MKYIILISLLLVGCDTPRDTKGRKAVWPTEYCMSGVVYYSWGHGMAPKFNPDSTVATCEARQ
ncbi:hypothetical protein KAR91_16625 [Candidatus Pacearchaeota archaeon]|nr:hypothetical protein [Candidatus Pacearchaeota archaeon]